jgi:hypothetical protein
LARFELFELGSHNYHCVNQILGHPKSTWNVQFRIR